MKYRSTAAVALFFAAFARAQAGPAVSPRVVQPLDQGWHFHAGDVSGAEAERFDAAGWQVLDIPHDWAVTQPIDRNNPAGGAGAFLPGGVVWYRKIFDLPPAADRRVILELDGVMANSDVWVNGQPVGHRPNGYVGQRYDITGQVRPGASNVVAVRADTTAQPASRWYAGTGIYRHARLVTTDALSLVRDGVFITTPAVNATEATVDVTAEVANHSAQPRTVTLHVDLTGPDGAIAASADGRSISIAAGATMPVTAQLRVARPVLWDIGQGAMYKAAVSVRDGGRVTDAEQVDFGIRQFRFEPATGFWINDRNVKIKGVCLHQDGGAVGAAVPAAVWAYRLEQLRLLGVNAIRTAHNPPDPALLDLCDRMGFVVMDELFDCWRVAKTRYDYHLYFDQWSTTDIRDTVRRDRNHPSVILWSAGNEIHDTPREAEAKEILKGLVAAFKESDTTRPVTQALFRPNVSHDYNNGLADLLDVVGQNYRERELQAAATQKPTRKIIGTENGQTADVWVAMREDARIAGQFLWAGIDYLGEARWPDTTSGSGVLDRTGALKPSAYQRQSWWSDVPMVRMTRRLAPAPRPATDPGYEQPTTQPRNRRPQLLSDWSSAVTTPHEETVEVYSNCPEVELWLNDRSLGKQSLPANAAPRTWKVPFEPGVLRAVGSKDGVTQATHELRTASQPAAVVLSVNRDSVGSSFDDLVFVTGQVVDSAGTPVPTNALRMTFHIDGPGQRVAVDSGANASHEPFAADTATIRNGRCVALVRGTGSGAVTIRATVDGMKAGSLTLTARP